MMECMMEDLRPALRDLKAAKADVAVVLGQKKDEDAIKGPTEVTLLYILTMQFYILP